MAEEHPNVDLLREAYAAYNRGDLDGFWQACREDFTFHVPGRSGIAGAFTGQAEFHRLIMSVLELAGGRFEEVVEDVLANDHHGVVLTLQRFERYGMRKEDPATPLKLALIAQAVASAATLLYLDECDLHLLPVIRACWMKGPRLRVPTPGQNAKRALFGALDARTGQLHHLVRPRKRAAQFVEFLEALAAAYPTGEVVLVLDNVITHDAKLVRAWRARPEHARFRFLWLPKYSAHEHNPIERVWGLMKDAVAANRLHGSIDLLVAEADRFFATTAFNAPHPLPTTPAIISDEVGQAA